MSKGISCGGGLSGGAASKGRQNWQQMNALSENSSAGSVNFKL